MKRLFFSLLRTTGPAALSALLFLLAFPPFSLWPLAFVCLIPLLFALDQAPPQRAFWLAGLFAVVFYAGLLHWIVFNPAVERWVRPLLYLGVALIAGYLALYAAAAAAAAAWVARRSNRPLWLLLPFAWTLADFVRGLGIMGFPWGSAGYAVTGFLPAIQMAEFYGIHGVTFWVVLVNGLMAAAAGRSVIWFRERRFPRRWEWLAVACGAAVFLVPVIGGQLRLRRIDQRAGAAPHLRIALVQGNIEQGLRWDREFQDFNWRTYRDLSLGAAAGRPALIIWPETAMPFYLRYQDQFMSEMVALTNSINSAVLTGVPDYHQELPSRRVSFYNSSFLFAPRRGLTGQYAKAHLVPFGEHFPLKEHIPWLKNINFGEGEWTPGADTGLFHLDSLAFANLICFESIFPGITRAQARRGARWFVVITNDGWFGRSGAARQHADMAVMRAVETRRSIARCANSGISMFILPTGQVLDPTPLYRQAVVARDIPVLSGLTFYVRHGDLFALLIALLFLGTAVAAIFKPRT